MQQDTNLIRQTVPQDEEGIRLIDAFHFIQNGWRTIGSTGAFGLLIGCAYAFLAPQKFQGEILIQGASVAGKPVEPPTVLIEKLKQPTYYSAGSITECALKETPTAKSTLAKNLKPALNKSAPVITMTYTADSAQIAKQCLESVLGDIANDQQQLAAPLIKTREDQLASTKTKLELAEKVMEQFGGRKLNFDIPDQKFSSYTLLYSIILLKQNEITELRKSIETQTIELSPPQTQAASATTPIYAPDMHVSPKRPIAIAGGLFGGVVLGMLWLLARQGWLKLKPQLNHH